jgi:hypothetical protein
MMFIFAVFSILIIIVASVAIAILYNKKDK